ncbi:hypothetical protein F5X68DRAFT_204519 [Plectosphaerella plurivora]|uniref:SnoaL-like domain-containing protein n=1 Tax=Plectosphaerella plurivora TaxID=936078 RepID=A0A9P9ABD5_9PEZI|nr:hypothetical protein F5X68DRAFT_204519 [Plectosphaerella plurivora]
MQSVSALLIASTLWPAYKDALFEHTLSPTYQFQTSTMAPSQTLLKTAKAYLTALEGVDAPSLEAVTTDNMTVTLAPASAGLGPSATRAELLGRFEGLKHILSSLHIEIKQIWVNEAANQVTIWTSGGSIFKPEVIGDDDAAEWEYNSENMFLFTMDEGGEKITHLLEWCDSLSVQKMMVLFPKAAERAQLAAGSS